MKKTMYCGWLFLSRLWCCDFHDFDIYQNKLHFEEVEYKIKKYLEKDPHIAEFYHLTHEALYIGDLAKEQVDFILHLSPKSTSQPKQPALNLKNIKIALDPGHFGGEYCKLEERYIHIAKEDIGEAEDISFDEGTLAFLTAIELKTLLEKQGAEVFISRPGIGKGAIQKDFFSWLSENSSLWNEKATLPQLFKLYNSEDLKARVNQINAYQPDLTVMIHYNASGLKRRNNGTNPLTRLNYTLAFIPGAFSRSDLKEKENRYEFLRLVVTNDLRCSLLLSEQIVQKFIEKLQISTLEKISSTPYLPEACIRLSDGIYARNLSLTRKIHGPLCYAEPLLQDNQEECRKLSLKDTEIGGIRCSSRLKDTAQAYYEGIVNYLLLLQQYDFR